MKSILITGGAGFIGSNFVPYFAAKYPDYFLVNLDLLTYAGDLANLREMAGVKNYAFVKGDIGDAALVSALFARYDFDGVIHFAAESHVDNSIANPRAFVETNVLGAFTLLDAARAHWRGEKRRFHHISTDEVYGSLGATGLFTEATPYAPNSPYSASKAASDMLARAFHHTYGIDATISNCSNNYGPKQHAEKLIPTIIRKALSGENIPLYGDGKNVRDWLYVLDHCRAIDLIFHRGAAGETYNIGGKNERTNLEIVAAICAVLDERRPRAVSYKEQITFVADRPGHDRRYAIDATKLATRLGWQAQESFDTGIVKTVEWYLAASGGECSIQLPRPSGRG
ncbi:MAG: dTDP-glucose 4,6-dehydratase [Planctomycetota bacterium]|jgi:dTDP-glucose 4,6-dehydratase|nr:dTDP-glucose 4,6-dehydratase [Planctomycetota bacterium]